LNPKNTFAGDSPASSTIGVSTNNPPCPPTSPRAAPLAAGRLRNSFHTYSRSTPALSLPCACHRNSSEAEPLSLQTNSQKSVTVNGKKISKVSNTFSKATCLGAEQLSLEKHWKKNPQKKSTRNFSPTWDVAGFYNYFLGRLGTSQVEKDHCGFFLSMFLCPGLAFLWRMCPGFECF